MSIINKKLFLLLFLLFSFSSFSQSFLIYYPEAPEDITVCEESSKLKIRLDALINTSSNVADIEIILGDGIEYVPESILKTGGSASLTIVENGGTLNIPIFKLTTSTTFQSNFIEFEIKRKAGCSARTNALAGTIFKDTVNATINSITTTKASPIYNVLFATLTFIQPPTINNVVNGNIYTRNFSITNGSDGCTQAVHFNIEYPNGQVIQQSLFLNGVPITPTAITGNTYFYTITGSNLTADGLICNGESLTFTETIKINSCNLQNTLYNIGWGCSSNPSNWCQTVSGLGSFSLASGTPKFTSQTQTKIGYTNMCTPFTMRSTFTNGGTGEQKAATMYNVTFKKGLVVASLLTIYAYDQRYNLGTSTINGLVVPSTLVGGVYQVNVTDFFPTSAPDPDGIGIGLEDIDNDGFYDDIPPGETVTLDTNFSFQCSNTCNLSINNYLFSGGIKYDDMCGTSIQPSSPSHPGGFETYQSSYSDVGLVAPNIVSATPFPIRMAIRYYYSSNNFRTSNTRFLYELTLPAGVSVIGNARWFNGVYPANSGTTGTATTYTQTGNLVTITSPNSNFGWTTIDLQYDCASGNDIVLDWKLKEINDITTPTCLCLSELVCGKLRTHANCISTCATVGVATNVPIVSRAANSLGWTNNTMQTIQTASNISAYDLSKALYLDEIEIISNGVQKGSAQNIFIRLQLNKAGTVNKLTPLNVDVTILRNGIPIVPTTNVTSFSLLNSTASEQFIDWNLTSILPPGGLIDGDEINTISRYQVAINNGLPQHDVQSANNFFMYNKDLITNTILTCNTNVPEMYLVGTGILNGANQHVVSGCNLTTLGGSTSYIARRFDASGLQYTNEFRPGLLVHSIVITMPMGYNFEGMTYSVSDGYGGSFPAIPDSIVGNILTFNNPGTWPAMNITVTNAYGAIVPLKVRAKCGTQEFETIKTEVFHTDYYYHYATGILPANNNLVANRTITYFNKPAIELTNLTGIVQANEPIESWTVRLYNNGYNTAPYTWLSIDNVPGVQIESLTHIPSGTIINPTTYAGGEIFYLDTAGITVGNFKDYNIRFSYTTCDPTNVIVKAGWNCNSFPANPSEEVCDQQAITLKFTPIFSNIEINSVLQPNSSVDMCQPIPYKFNINSIEAGNTINNTFSIIPVNGLTPEANSFEAEYPLGSGNWQTITHTMNGNNFVYNLTTHTNYPGQGLPGTITDGGDINNRVIAVRFNMLTSCNFISGTSFQVKADANSICGISISSGVIQESLPIRIYDVPDYIVINDLVVDSGSFTGCSSMVTLLSTSTIISSVPINNTGSIKITIPQGFNYVVGSFSCISTLYCPTLEGVSIDSFGDEVITLSIPAGMSSSDTISYTVQIQENLLNPIGCISNTINVISLDESQNIICASSSNGICPSVTVLTGNTSLNFTTQKAILSVVADSVASSINGINENITANFTINNSSTLVDSNSNLVIDAFYDLNNDNQYDIGDLLLGSSTISNTVLANNSASGSISFTAVPNQICNLLLVIRSSQNPCICSTVSTALTAPIVLEGIAGLDKTVCDNASVEIGLNNNNSYTYSWSAINSNILAYLDATNVSNPNFNYSGVSLLNTTNLTYILNITRPNGCVSSDEVTITINTTPIADSPSDVTACDSYTLPALSVGNYFTLTNGTGTSYNAGDVISTTTTLFVYAETGTTPNCTNENSFTITINTSPSVVNTTIKQCDDDLDGIANFTLNSFENSQLLLGNAQLPADFTITYYNSIINAQNGTTSGLLANIYTNSTNPQIIYPRVVNNLSGCVNANAEVTLFVKPKAIANQVTQTTLDNSFIKCDNYNFIGDYYDGLAQFNLTDAEADIIGSQFPSDVSIKFYANLADYNAGTSIPTAALSMYVNTSPFAQTIYVRVEQNNEASDMTAPCFEFTTFDLVVKPLAIPIITSLNNSHTICVEWGTNVLLSGLTLDSGVSATGYTFQWSLNNIDIPGATGATHTISTAAPGDYTVVAKNTTTLTCTSQTAAIFNVIQSGPAANSQFLTNASFGDIQNITILNDGFGEYHFQLNLDGPILDNGGIFYDVPEGIHTVYIYDVKTDNPCDFVQIKDVYILKYPHFFTPNGDGINDEWKITGLKGQTNAKIYIFDRYGKLIKQISPHADSGWNGTINGQPLPATDYWFTVEYFETSSLGLLVPKQFKAHFSLKR